MNHMPYFFEVTTDVYLQIFNEFVNQLTDDVLTTGYYQQDSATCHTSNASMREIENFLKPKLSQKNLATQISRSDAYRLLPLGPIEGQNVKIYTPHNRTTQRDQTVNVNTLGKVFQNLEKRIQMCLDVKGDQFQHRL